MDQNRHASIDTCDKNLIWPFQVRKWCPKLSCMLPHSTVAIPTHNGMILRRFFPPR